MGETLDRNATALCKMRTGCTACMTIGRPCDPANPHCQRAISDQWRVNEPLANVHQFGAWRERQAAHFFILEYVHLNELAGLFWSKFWHESVPRAVLHSEALSCLASAIGMLREDRMAKRSRRLDQTDASPSLSGALQLCNRAINLLVAPISGVLDPEIGLIACILLTHLENEQSHGLEALSHVVRGPQILSNLEDAHERGDMHGVLDLEDARRIVNGLAIQAHCVRGGGDHPEKPRLAEWRIKLPKISAFNGLDDAHSLLHSVYLLLLPTGDVSTGGMSAKDVAENVSRRRAIFIPWLLEWEHCFHALLSRECSTWSDKREQSANVLLANYHIMMIFTKLDATLASPWSCFSNEFRMIVDLCASVLEIHTIELPPLSSNGLFPLFANELSVMQPLYYTMARCTDYTVRVKAGQMLLALRKPTGLANLSASVEQENERDGFHFWTLDDWLEFSATESLHLSPAAFFGGMYSGNVSIRRKTLSPASDFDMEFSSM